MFATESCPFSSLMYIRFPTKLALPVSTLPLFRKTRTSSPSNLVHNGLVWSVASFMVLFLIVAFTRRHTFYQFATDLVRHCSTAVHWRVCGKNWCSNQDSNLGGTGYEPGVLPTELLERFCQRLGGVSMREFLPHRWLLALQFKNALH